MPNLKFKSWMDSTLLLPIEKKYINLSDLNCCSDFFRILEKFLLCLQIISLGLSGNDRNDNKLSTSNLWFYCKRNVRFVKWGLLMHQIKFMSLEFLLEWALFLVFAKPQFHTQFNFFFSVCILPVMAPCCPVRAKRQSRWNCLKVGWDCRSKNISFFPVDF